MIVGIAELATAALDQLHRTSAEPDLQAVIESWLAARPTVDGTATHPGAHAP